MYSVFFTAAACLPAAPPAAAPAAPADALLLLPARLLMLSPRDTAGGRPPTAVPVVLCMLLARRLLLVAAVVLPGPGPASDRVCLRAHAGILSSGLLPCSHNTPHRVGWGRRKGVPACTDLLLAVPKHMQAQGCSDCRKARYLAAVALLV